MVGSFYFCVFWLRIDEIQLGQSSEMRDREIRWPRQRACLIGVINKIHQTSASLKKKTATFDLNKIWLNLNPSFFF
jgi:hypothetical protein